MIPQTYQCKSMTRQYVPLLIRSITTKRITTSQYAHASASRKQGNAKPKEACIACSGPNMIYRSTPNLTSGQRSIRHKTRVGSLPTRVNKRTARVTTRVATLHSSLTPHFDQGCDPTRVSCRTIYYIYYIPEIWLGLSNEIKQYIYVLIGIHTYLPT